MRVKLTDRFVAAAKSGDAVQADFFDEDNPGLALRVSRTGRKAWSFVFTSPKDGKRARVSLGIYPGMTLAAARGRALEARQHLENSPPRDPREVWAAEAAGAMTVRSLVESYMTKHVRPHRRSAEETGRRFGRNVLSVIGDLRAAELHRRDVNRVVDAVLARGAPVEANRTFEDMRAMLRWAVGRGDIDHSPMEGMSKPTKPSNRERVLTDAEIRTLWTGLPKALSRSPTCQRILRLCLVTAQRVGEVAGMSSAEVDRTKRIWVIPARRSKNGHSHAVPLSDLAMSIIDEALAAAGQGATYLFPDAEGEGALSGAAVARTVLRAHEPSESHPQGRFGIAQWTAHDLRRTAVSQMAALGIAPIVLGHVINHRSVTKAGVTLAVYSQYDYAREKREALELWADRLNAIVLGSANVVSIRSAHEAG